MASPWPRASSSSASAARSCPMSGTPRRGAPVPPARAPCAGAAPRSPGGQRLRERYPAIRLIGAIAFHEVPMYLGAADIVAVPQRQSSDTRGQVPAKIFDAMALGRAVISTPVSMIPEILDGCGVLVPPGNVAALAEAMARLADHPDEAAALGRRAGGGGG